MTTNLTADEYIDLVPSDLGATVYVEVIIVSPESGLAGIGYNTACGRSCDSYSGVSIVRDLHLPGNSIKLLLAVHGFQSSDYVPYYRDYNTNTISDANFSDITLNRQSIIFFHSSLSAARISYVLGQISSRREILPSRVV